MAWIDTLSKNPREFEQFLRWGLTTTDSDMVLFKFELHNYYVIIIFHSIINLT